MTYINLLVAKYHLRSATLCHLRKSHTHCRIGLKEKPKSFNMYKLETLGNLLRIGHQSNKVSKVSHTQIWDIPNVIIYSHDVICPTLQISFGEWSVVVWPTRPSFWMLTIAWMRFALNYGNRAYRIGWAALMSQWMSKSSVRLGTGEVESQVLEWNWRVASFEMILEITFFWVCFAEVGILVEWKFHTGSNRQLKWVPHSSTYQGRNL